MDTARFRIRPGQTVNLHRYAADDTRPFKHKRKATGKLEKGVERLVTLQEQLYAQDRWSVLLIFQGMDASGKDSAIKHVMSGLNPQGTQVYSFKRPSDEELDHDYLWRSVRALPERGRIGIFNRSYYEEVLVVRVHDDLLQKEKLPPSLVTKDIFEDRFDDIRHFERYLTRNGVVIRKFFLHISKKEQKQRFLERIETPSKNWKFSAHDVQERSRWRAYMAAYQDMIQHTSTADSPWYVVPADHKWFARLVVAGVVAETLAGVDLQFPRLDRARRKELEAARATLEHER